MKTIHFYTLIFSFFLWPALGAQHMKSSVLSSSGRHHENSGIYLQWTLGELLINEYQEINVGLGEGFHWGSQAPQEFHTSQTNNREFAKIMVVPNPADHFIRIVEPENSDYSFRYHIASSANSMVLSGTSYVGNHISVTQLPPGFYFITIIYPDSRQYYQRFALVR